MYFFQMELGMRDFVLLVKRLLEILKFVDNEFMVSGDLYVVVDMLKKLDQRILNNEILSKEEVDLFIKVGVFVKFLFCQIGVYLRKCINKDIYIIICLNVIDFKFFEIFEFNIWQFCNLIL